MQLIFLLLTCFVWVRPSIFSTNITYSSQAEQINTSDYVGAWVGHTATSEFKIVLEERKNYRLSNGHNYDIIVGKHSFVTKGSTQKNESLSKPSESFALTGMLDSRFPGKLTGGFTDEVNNKSVRIRLSFVDGNKNKILWQVTGENEVIITEPGAKFLPGISVPTTIIMEKVK